MIDRKMPGHGCARMACDLHVMLFQMFGDNLQRHGLTMAVHAYWLICT